MVIIPHCDYIGSKCIFRCILQIGPRKESNEIDCDMHDISIPFVRKEAAHQFI